MDDDQSDRLNDRPSEPTGQKHPTVRYEMVEPTLFVTDAEMIRRMGVPEKTARAALRELDRDKGSGFPQKKSFVGKSSLLAGRETVVRSDQRRRITNRRRRRAPAAGAGRRQCRAAR
jgi:hypothetical protein